MRKLVLILVILLVLGGTAFAFDPLSYPPPVEGGDLMIDAGLGYVVTGWSDGKFGIPPIFVIGEFALPVGVPISVGAIVSFFQWKYDYTLLGSKYGYTETFIVPAFRANWHWGFDVNWLDFYTGLSLGYAISSVKYRGGSAATGAAGGYFFWAGQVGAHFYFTKSIGAMVEFGYPFLIKGGVALKL